MLQRLGGWMVGIGAIITALALSSGFVALFRDLDSLAKVLLGLVPVGFVLLFAGLVTVLMVPRDDR